MIRNWNILRAIRLAIGLYVLIHGIVTYNWVYIGFGAYFTAMPLFNFGCCAVGNCAATPAKLNKTETDDIQYEEVR